MRFSALLITFFTGVTGLIYEVTWHRYLSNFIGSQAQAAALILAVFLGGLCAGYILFGKMSRGRSPRFNLKLTGWIEIVIGLWAFFFPRIYDFFWQLSGILSPESPFILELGICIALIGLPTLCMGGTLPLLTQGLSTDLDDSSSFHARVYAINTAGAFLGCLIAGFVLLPQLGLARTMLTTAPVNILAGVGLLIIGMQLSNHPVEQKSEESSPQAGTLPFSLAVIISFLAGFYSLSLQTVFMRLVGLSMGSSEYSFAMIVAVFVLMLALGAWLLAGQKDSSDHSIGTSLWSNQALVLFGSLLIYLSVPYWPYTTHIIRSLLSSVPPNFYVYHGVMFLVLLLLLAVPVGAMGGTMPLVFSNVRRSISNLGQNVGVLYGWNTIGCVIGALVGGHLLLYEVNLDIVYQICLGLMVLSFILASYQAGFLVRTVAVVSLALPFLLPLWPKSNLANGLFRLRSANINTFKGADIFYQEYLKETKLLAYEDGPNTSVGVVEFSNISAEDRARGFEFARALYVNGKSDGITSGRDLRTTRLLAHLPALFSGLESPHAAVVGFGTGITPASLALYDEIQEIDCIEISPVVKRYAPYFDFATRNVSESPKLSWKIGDGYRILGTSQRKYSVITSEPSNPWVTGVERLYSQEFYQIVSNSLTPEGVYAQWFHSYAASPRVVGLIVNTFASVFPEVRAFKNGHDWILIGAKKPIRDLARLQKRLQDNPLIAKELKEVGLETINTLAAMEIWLSSKAFPESGIHTLEYPKLSYTAGRDFFLGRPAGVLPTLEKPSKRALIKASSHNSLIARSRISKEELPAIAQRYCSANMGQLVTDWKKKPLACRQVVAALVAGEQLEVNENFEVLKKLSQTTEIAKDIPEALTGILFYQEYASPFLDIPIERLRTFIAPCFKKNTPEAQGCRLRFVEALALNAHGREARGELEQIDWEIPAATIKRLRILIAQAENASPTPQTYGKYLEPALPSVDFSLESTIGPVTADTFRGEEALVFFGFTHCPDVCPLTIQRITRALQGRSMRVLFVSVDPERDTVEVLKSYLKPFGSNFIGLTGTTEQIKSIAKGYGAYFEKVSGVDASYLMSHSPYIFGINRQGNIQMIWNGEVSGEQLAKDLEYLR